MPFNTVVFLGCSVRGFTSGIGWNGSTSTLSVQLVEDPQQAQVFTPVPTGTPVFFEFGEFKFYGLFQKWEKKNGPDGLPLYEVTVSDPRELLDGVQVVLAGYNGSVAPITNIVNVYGFWENQGFGLSYSNEAGIPWFRVRDGILAICNQPNQTAFGGPITRRGVTYSLDLSQLPEPPGLYRVGGSTSIGLLELISQICEDGGCDYFVTLDGFRIKVRTVSRRTQPPLGTIEAMTSGGSGVVRTSYGLEARNEVTSSFLVGGEVQVLQMTDAITSFWGYDVAGSPSLGTRSRLDLADDRFTGELEKTCTATAKTLVFKDDRWVKPANHRWPPPPCYMRLGNEIVKLTGFANGTYTVERAQFGTTRGQHPAGTKATLVWWSLYCDFMSLNASPVADVIGAVAYPCTTFELRLAKANFDSWATYMVNYRKFWADRIGITTSFKFQGGIGMALGNAAVNAQKDNAVNLAQNAVLGDVWARQMRMYEFVRGYADEYMGKKFAVGLPFVLSKQDPETLRVSHGYDISDGGYLPEGSEPLGLSPLNEDVFKTQDGRFRSFCVFTDLNNVDFSLVSPQGTVAEDGVLYMDCQADRSIVFTPTPAAILTLQGSLTEEASDPVGDLTPLAAAFQMVADTAQKILGNPQFGNVGVRIAPDYKTPAAVAVPLKSNTSCYGPWYAAGASGKVRFEQDGSLVPWNYGGYDTMNAAALARVSQSLTRMVESESGQVEQVGMPTASLGDTLRTGGPNLTSVQVSFGTSGVTTTYSFQTYTPRPYVFGKGNSDRMRRLALADVELRRSLRASIKEDAGRADAIGNAVRANKAFMGNAPKVVKKDSPHDVLIAVSIADTEPAAADEPGVQQAATGKTRVGVATATLPEAVAACNADDDTKYQATTVMSWSGLVRAFATQQGGGNLVPSYKEPTSGFAVNLSKSGLDPWKAANDIDVFTAGNTYQSINARDSGSHANARVFGLRGPLVVSGWGWDVEGTLVPAGVTDYLNHYEAWKTGPVDLVWDNRRGVWTSHDVLRGRVSQQVPASVAGSGGLAVRSNGTESSWELAVYNVTSSAISVGQEVYALYSHLDQKWFAFDPTHPAASGGGGTSPSGYAFHNPEFEVSTVGSTVNVQARWGTNVQSVAWTNTAGTGQTFARDDHAHAHPVFASGDLHPEYALPTPVPYTVLYTPGAGSRRWEGVPALSGVQVGGTGPGNYGFLSVLNPLGSGYRIRSDTPDRLWDLILPTGTPAQGRALGVESATFGSVRLEWLPISSGYRYQFHQTEFTVTSGDPTTVAANWGTTATAVGYVSSPGVLDLFARADHIHQHPVMPTGNFHPEYAWPTGPTYSVLWNSSSGTREFSRVPEVSGVYVGGPGLGSVGYVTFGTPLGSGYRVQSHAPDRMWTLSLPDNAPSSGQVLAVAPLGDSLQTYWASQQTGSWSSVSTVAAITSDVTISSTSMANVTGLSFSVGANETWDFEFVVLVNANSGMGLLFQLTGPSSPTAIAIQVFGNGSSTTTFAMDTMTAFSTPTANTYCSAGTSTGLVRITGRLRNGSNAGTVQLQAAKSNMIAASQPVKAESKVTAWKN